MRVKTLNSVGAALLVIGGLGVPAQASDWGCEVLLCASSSNPSWRGVPACHPHDPIDFGDEEA